MPGGDCTGPWWSGSRGNKPAGYNPWCSRAAGFGRGGGRGFGRYSGVPFRQPTPEEERECLEAVARNLEDELKSLRAQIEMLHSSP